jgi:hypothetical protein
VNYVWFHVVFSMTNNIFRAVVYTQSISDSITKVTSNWENIFLALRLDGHKFLLFFASFLKKEIKNIIPTPRFKPKKIRLEAHGANYYTTDARWLLKQIFNLLKCMLHKQITIAILPISCFEAVLTSEITF